MITAVIWDLMVSFQVWYCKHRKYWMTIGMLSHVHSLRKVLWVFERNPSTTFKTSEQNFAQKCFKELFRLANMCQYFNFVPCLQTRMNVWAIHARMVVPAVKMMRAVTQCSITIYVSVPVVSQEQTVSEVMRMEWYTRFRLYFFDKTKPMYFNLLSFTPVDNCIKIGLHC